MIHYVSSEGIVYLVVADDTVGRRTPFAFLAEVERRVRSSWTVYTPAQHSLSGMTLSLQFKTRFSPEDLESSSVTHSELQDAFEGELEALMQQYTTNPPNDPLKQAQSDLNNVQVSPLHCVPPTQLN